MIAIVFATDREAAPFLLKAGLDVTGERGRTVFDLRPGRQVVICICGMGPKAALENMRRLLDDYPVVSVINAGAAGAVSEGKRPGDVFRITSTLVWPAISGAYQCMSKRWLDLQTASLATVERPVFDPELRREIAVSADLVDMEGAFVAQACREKGIPFDAIKGVTDLAGEGDRQTLYANLDNVSGAIADLIWKELNKEGTEDQGHK